MRLALCAEDIAVQRDLSAHNFSSPFNDQTLPDCTFGASSISISENTYSFLGG